MSAITLKALKAFGQWAGVALLLGSVSGQALAQDLYFHTYHPDTNSMLQHPERCGKACPEVDFQLVDTGHAWLDSRLNKTLIDVLFAAGNDEATKRQAQALQAIATPTPAQYATAINAAIDSLVRENAANIEARGNWQTGDGVPVQVSAQPHYKGHRGSLELFAVDSYVYLGGAHGVNSIQHFVFDSARQRRVTLDDILLPKQKPRLEALARADFSAQLKRNEIDPVKHLKDWTFVLTDNYTWTRAGLLLQYQPYELAYYAFGAPTIVIPYAKLSGIVRPEYLPN